MQPVAQRIQTQMLEAHVYLMSFCLYSVEVQKGNATRHALFVISLSERLALGQEQL